MFLMSACSDSDTESEVPMNTIQPYYLTDEESEIVDIANPDAENAFFEFTVDETYEELCAGYDYYENGKLVAEDCAVSEFPFHDDGGPRTTYGRIFTDLSNDVSTINIQGGGIDTGIENGLGSETPLSNEDQTFEDIEFQSMDCLLENPTSIANNKKIYIWAAIGDNDNEVEVAPTLMTDKDLLASYDKCFAFYVVFRQKGD